jgi:hypothetical protein
MKNQQQGFFSQTAQEMNSTTMNRRDLLRATAGLAKIVF